MKQFHGQLIALNPGGGYKVFSENFGCAPLTPVWRWAIQPGINVRDDALFFHEGRVSSTDFRGVASGFSLDCFSDEYVLISEVM